MAVKRLWLPILALLFAIFTGYVNLTANEVQAPMLCILIGAGLLGFLRPKTAWLWGLLIGGSIPASYLIASALSLMANDPPRSPLSTVVLIIPALIAAYIGALLGKTIHSAEFQS